MATLSSTTTGQDICENVTRVLEAFELNPAKLCRLTTDGAPSMTDRPNGFTQKIMDAIGAQDVVVIHCIIHNRTFVPKIWHFQML